MNHTCRNLRNTCSISFFILILFSFVCNLTRKTTTRMWKCSFRVALR
eukprot:UN04493